MARIRFVGDSATCAWLGVKFQHGEWIAEHGLGPDELARVAAHRDFEIEVEGAPAKTKPQSKA